MFDFIIGFKKGAQEAFDASAKTMEEMGVEKPRAMLKIGIGVEMALMGVGIFFIGKKINQHYKE